jgi:hypothetical protein
MYQAILIITSSKHAIMGEYMFFRAGTWTGIGWQAVAVAVGSVASSEGSKRRGNICPSKANTARHRRI